MDRTPLPAHPLARSPHKETAALLCLVALGATLVLWGRAAFAGAVVAGLAGLGGYGYACTRRRLRAPVRDRARDAARHSALLSARTAWARTVEWEHRPNSAQLAAGWGRIEQTVPDDLHALQEREIRLAGEQRVRLAESTRTALELPLRHALARHAASLTAEGVVRGQERGFPVTVFDLELIDHADLRRLRRGRRIDEAVELAKDYLTIWTVTLPLALPYLSCAYAWDGQYGETDRERQETGDRSLQTEDTAFAEALLAHPAIRSAALAPHAWPWWIDGDRLCACARTNAGVAPEAVAAVASELASLAARFPWPELETYRVPADQPHRARRALLTHRLHRPHGAPAVDRWEEHPLSLTGLRAFCRTAGLVWTTTADSPMAAPVGASPWPGRP